MNKKLLLIAVVLVALAITAYGAKNVNDDVSDLTQAEATSTNPPVTSLENPLPAFPDFFYNVGTRFGPISKKEIEEATSLYDFIPEMRNKELAPNSSVSVITFKDDVQPDIRELGDGSSLTEKQKQLLRTADYSTNFTVKAYYKLTNLPGNEYYSPYLTIVPHKQAKYHAGNEALLVYLKENSREYTLNIEEQNLRPAKLYFTVTKEGTIGNLELYTTSGYPEIDATMMELMQELPGSWEPAQNAQGEAVDQELVFSFGAMGC